MAEPKRKKVESTPFSDFIRYASSQEKSEFFTEVVKETIKEQREMIAKAQNSAATSQ